MNLHTSKIGKQFVSQTIDVEATTFTPSRMQNLVKIGIELWA